MSKIIQVSDLSKSYIISHEGRESYTSLRDVMAQKAKKLFSFPGWNSKTAVTKEEFWALKDVSFDIEQGDRVGIIGRNGAGKSTLLKILSRITEPTSGEIKIKGRVASLLEVGTGFHPELTGRENIYLNGAILGMSRVEIRKHFDAIVDFAEVEKFLDTPVKRYSSGMYVRLAFAVAAHLEPEVLVVDEVLAVGDAEFQKKCLGKMEDVSKNEGRTVLFVSHNMDAIRILCSKSMHLKNGQLLSFSKTEEIITEYTRDLKISLKKEYTYTAKKPSITMIELDNFSLVKGKLLLKIHFKSPFLIKKIHPGIVLYNSLNHPIFGSNSRYHKMETEETNVSEGIITASLPDLNLHSGVYKISFWLGDDYTDFDFKEHAIIFDYLSNRPYPFKPDTFIIGCVDNKIEWQLGR